MSRAGIERYTQSGLRALGYFQIHSHSWGLSKGVSGEWGIYELVIYSDGSTCPPGV